VSSVVVRMNRILSTCFEYMLNRRDLSQSTYRQHPNPIEAGTMEVTMGEQKRNRTAPVTGYKRFLTEHSVYVTDQNQSVTDQKIAESLLLQSDVTSVETTQVYLCDLLSIHVLTVRSSPPLSELCTSTFTHLLV